MKKAIIGAVAGGIVLFVWQFASWMFLGIHELDTEPVLGDEAAVVKALDGTAKGVYWIPGMKQADMKDPDSAAYKDWEKRHEKGPRAWIVYDPAGGKPMQTKQMVTGALLAILTALVAALMLHSAGIRSYFGRVLFVAGFGVLLAIGIDLQNWNWMNYPMDWTIGWVLDHVGGMAILGLLLGLIVKPAH